MGLKEVAQKFSMTKKELDQVYFSEMRSILNALEKELEDSRNFGKLQKELLNNAEEVVMEYGHYGRVSKTTISNLEKICSKIEVDNNA